MCAMFHTLQELLSTQSLDHWQFLLIADVLYGWSPWHLIILSYAEIMLSSSENTPSPSNWNVTNWLLEAKMSIVWPLECLEKKRTDRPADRLIFTDLKVFLKKSLPYYINCCKDVSVYKPRVVFVVIREIWNNCYRFFQIFMNRNKNNLRFSTSKSLNCKWKYLVKTLSYNVTILLP